MCKNILVNAYSNIPYIEHLNCTQEASSDKLVASEDAMKLRKIASKYYYYLYYNFVKQTAIIKMEDSCIKYNFRCH